MTLANQKEFEFPPEDTYLSLELARYWPIILIVLAVLIIESLSLTVLARSGTQPLNPFSSYTDLLGQSRNAFITRGFSCRLGTYPVLPGEYCALNVDARAFSQVGVVINNGFGKRIDFITRGNALQAGDLFLWFGKTTAYTHGQMVDFFWPGGVSASAISENGRISYFLPIRSVSFTAIPA